MPQELPKAAQLLSPPALRPFPVLIFCTPYAKCPIAQLVWRTHPGLAGHSTHVAAVLCPVAPQRGGLPWRRALPPYWGTLGSQGGQ